MLTAVRVAEVRLILAQLPDLTEYPFINTRMERVEGILLDQQFLEDVKDLLIDYLHLLEGEEAA